MVLSPLRLCGGSRDDRLACRAENDAEHRTDVLRKGEEQNLQNGETADTKKRTSILIQNQRPEMARPAGFEPTVF